MVHYPDCNLDGVSVPESGKIDRVRCTGAVAQMQIAVIAILSQPSHS
jgi:hypothetical protein